MLSVYPYVITLLFWVIFFIAIFAPVYIVQAFFALLILFIGSVVVVGRPGIFKNWVRWINILLFFISSFGFVLIIGNPVIRNIYTIIAGFIVALVMLVMTGAERRIKGYVSRRYLELVTFVYLVTFWQVSALIFFVLVSYDQSILSTWRAIFIFIPVVYIVGRGITSVRSPNYEVSNVSLAVTVLTVSELVYMLELLPVHYFVSATILTMWFFFVTDITFGRAELSNRRKHFNIYTLLLLIVIALLLITAEWG